MYKIHEPVLASETIEYLNIRKNKNYIDCTLGSGGHSEKMLKLMSHDATLTAIDLDEEAIEYSKNRLSGYGAQVKYVNKNFRDIKNIVQENNIENIGGILMDLGVSTHQILSGYRGFSYMNEGDLDMRMGNQVEKDAKNVLNNYPKADLEMIFREYGELKSAKKLVREIIKKRKKQEIRTTSELTDIIKYVFSERSEKTLIKLSAKIFQALRIAVNEELESLKQVVGDAIELLPKDGRLVIISYHSLEDRIVKNIFKEYMRDCICPTEIPECRCEHEKTINILTRKVVVPSEDEIKQNPKSRSAKLRACIKL